MGNQEGNRGNRPNRALSITVHLERGQDDDLINTMGSVPKGSRATVVKKALRGVASGAGAAAFALPQQMALPGMMPDHSKALKEIVGDMTWMKQAITDMPGYFERLIRQVASSPVGAAPARASPEPEPARAPDVVLQQRDERLKKAKW